MGRLQLALDEHNLELRVKNANEAEAACQQKLAAVEAEIAELRQSLQASYRYNHQLMTLLSWLNFSESIRKTHRTIMFSYTC